MPLPVRKKGRKLLTVDLQVKFDKLRTHFLFFRFFFSDFTTFSLSVAYSSDRLRLSFNYGNLST